MKQIALRTVGGSLYFRIPIEWVRANDLKNNDLAFLKLIDGRSHKFEVTLVKIPVPKELLQEYVQDLLQEA